MLRIFKKRKLINALCRAFPADLRPEAEGLFKRLMFASIEEVSYDESFHWKRKKIGEYEAGRSWTLTGGEKIYIPYRVYFSEALMPPAPIVPLSEIEEIIFHCIFSRSADGYARERHIEALLSMGADRYEWVKPYIIAPCGEYVVEILEMVYEKLDREKIPEYRSFCKLNFEIITYFHARMISYWNEFCRNDCYYYENYIGKKLFAQIFGMRKSGQKSIEIN